MIKDNIEYLYLIVPNEYRCVYYNILDTLGTLGEDLLSSCTATCKGRAINGIACYNMFLAACACYYLGQVRRARVLINYIKAQLEIDCNKNIIFENSISDEWVYSKVPKVYQCVFSKLLDKMSTWGQELLDDCTASCRGNNKNILNAWNLLQSASLAYEYDDVTKANKIVDYIKGLLGFDCPDEEPTFEEPSLTNFVLNTNYKEDGPTIDILNGTVNIENADSIVPNSMKLINYSTGTVLAENLSINETINFNIEDVAVEYSSNIDFMLQVTGTDGLSYYSNAYRVTIPDEPPHFNAPILNLTNVNYNIVPIGGVGGGGLISGGGLIGGVTPSVEYANLVINGFTATCENIESINSDGLTLSLITIPIRTNIAPQNNIEVSGLEFTERLPINTMTVVILSCVGLDNKTYKSEFSINIVPVNRTLTINATPSDAVVLLNGSQRNQITVPINTYVSINVSKQGYKTYVDNYLVTKDATLNIALQEDIPTDCTFIVNTVPSDAIVEINGVVRNQITVPAGTGVNVVVSKTGYRTYTGSYLVTEDTTVNITLERIQTILYRIIVNTTPEDAIVTINDNETKEAYYPAGEEITIVTSKEGYITDTRQVTITQEETINVTLEREPEIYYTVNAEVLPSQAQNKQATILNVDTEEEYVSTGQFKAGTNLRIAATATDYASDVLDYTVDAADAVNGVINKNIQLSDDRGSVIIQVYGDANNTIRLNNSYAILRDPISQRVITPTRIQDNEIIFENILIGDYIAEVSHEGYDTDTRSAPCIADMTYVYQMTLVITTAELHVYVFADSGFTTPLPNSTAKVINTQTQEEITYSGNTDNHIIIVGIPIGSYDCVVSHTGYDDAHETITVVDNTPQTINVYLNATQP